MSVPHDFTDDEERGYEEMDERLKRFDAGLDAILLREKAESEDLLLTPRQLDWRELRFFFEASIVNAGDLFGYLSVVYDRPELFERIGALKTLAAAEKLRNLHGQYSRLPDDEAKNQFWLATRERRKPIEETAEGLCEFADLLIRFAERHPKEFREIEI